MTTANLTAYHEDARRAFTQAHQALWQRTATQPATFFAYAHAAPPSADRFADPHP
ncbi:hypothetical protein WDV93_23125 [Pantoea ananatis]